MKSKFPRLNLAAATAAIAGGLLWIFIAGDAPAQQSTLGNRATVSGSLATASNLTASFSNRASITAIAQSNVFSVFTTNNTLGFAVGTNGGIYTAGGARVTGAASVGGALTVTGAGDVGGALTVAGVLTISPVTNAASHASDSTGKLIHGGTTNTWGNAVVPFDRGPILLTNMAGNLTITGVSGFSDPVFNKVMIRFLPGASDRTLAVPNTWNVGTNASAFNVFTNATTATLAAGTIVWMHVECLVGIETNAWLLAAYQ